MVVNQAIATQSNDFIRIDVNEELLEKATQKQRNDFVAELFIGLTKAVSNGYVVDISNPLHITARKID